MQNTTLRFGPLQTPLSGKGRIGTPMTVLMNYPGAEQHANYAVLVFTRVQGVISTISQNLQSRGNSILSKVFISVQQNCPVLIQSVSGSPWNLSPRYW